MVTIKIKKSTMSPAAVSPTHLNHTKLDHLPSFQASYWDISPIFSLRMLFVSNFNVPLYSDSLYEYSSSMFWLSHSTTELSIISSLFLTSASSRGIHTSVLQEHCRQVSQCP